ncbi:H+/Cl- antiporter ClcA [Cellulomonas sp. PhB143]|nr:H+/Cl- antiporter ClcA [Cellulomonas sp. PhB143]
MRAPLSREDTVLLLYALLVGVLAALGATVYSSLLHGAEHLVWDAAPEAFGADDAPWWWVLAVLAVGAVAVWGAKTLPGHGGHHPLDGLAFDITPRMLASTLLAAFATLVCGAVVGPEAPLLAIGTSVGFWLLRPAGGERARILVISGAAAALGVVMGNPLVTGLLVLEASILRPGPGARPRRPLVQLVPVLSALGAGYLVHVGVADWPGVSVPNLTAGDLGPYPSVSVADLLTGVVVAVAAAGLVVLGTRTGERLRRVADRSPLPTIVLAGVGVGVLALVSRAITGADVDMVLFSGQTTLAGLTGVGAGSIVVIAVAKALAYALSMGGGFRGGAIFPAVFLGMAAGVAGAALVPGATVPGLAACGIAAGAAATLGMPLTSVLLAVLLTIGSGPAVTVTAILGAVLGLLVKLWLDARRDGVLPDLPGVDEAPATRE